MRSETIEIACANRGYNKQQIEDAAAMMPESLQAFIRGVAFQAVIVEDLNDGRIPDHKNYGQTKYEPVFDLSVPGPAGLGLAFNSAHYWFTSTNAGARLQILDRGDAVYFGTHPEFQQIHADALTYKAPVKNEENEKN